MIMKTIMSNKVDLYSLFCELRDKGQNNDNYFVSSISDCVPHKLGCSPEGFPIFFIECYNKENTSDIKLKLFSVLFNRQCSISNINEEVSSTKYYSLIQLNSTNIEFVRYFLEVIYLILCKIDKVPNNATLKNEIIKVVKLFTTPTTISKDTVKGLWAELFVIDQSSDPNYLIKAWHSSLEDKYDFNDGIDKIEVKSTSGSKREHTFSIEQLTPNENSNLLVASVFVIQSGMGKNVFNLLDDIQARITDIESQIKIKEQVLQTIGPHIDEVTNLYFDYPYACQLYGLFDYKDVPSIDATSIPPQVSSVHFRSDLSAIDSADLNTYDSQLFKNLKP